MNDNNENKTDNNEDELFIIYKKHTIVSHYLGKLLETQGHHIRKGLINGDIVIQPLGEYQMMYQMNTDIEKIVRLLMMEIGDEPKPLQNKEMKDRPYKMTFNV